MKYPQQNSMPSGIQLWLEDQLEARGVDSTIYSKYILSVLSNPSDSSPKSKDPAVKKLIDELSVQLKAAQEKAQNTSVNSTQSKLVKDHSLSQGKAGRSLTSNPSLSSKPKTDHTNTNSTSSIGLPGGKRTFKGSAAAKNRTVSESYILEKKIHTNNNKKENKENNGCNKDANDKIRSRSTVKQHTPETRYRNMAKSLDRNEDFNCNSEMSKARKVCPPPNKSKQIQSLWANENSFEEFCDQDLPMDFQQLLESPEGTKNNAEFTRSVGTKHAPSFIQCGTNITSSIWSEKAEDAMDCSISGELPTDFSFNLNQPVWDMSEDAHAKSDFAQDVSSQQTDNLWWGNNRWDLMSGMIHNILMINNNNPWKALGNIESKDTFGSVDKLWSDIESTRLLLNEALSNNFYSSIGPNTNTSTLGSLNALNHNKGDSSFTEVIPKVLNNSGSTAKAVVSMEHSVNIETTIGKKEEEDLLTSMKTHFRPIKQETIEIVPSTASQRFPDGATFPISNSLDKVNFHKSPNGGFYLDSDVNNKYMEFNDADDDCPSEFVPKFRVCQNEKPCQTEELETEPIYCDIEPNSTGLFFPEDEKLVKSMTEDEIEEKPFWGNETCIKVDGWVTSWPTTGIWSNKPSVQQIWCGGNMWNNSEESEEAKKPGEDQLHYKQLRNEWTQEAEELLSDISQHLCLSNYMDTQPPKATLVESAWGQLSAIPLQASYPVIQS